MPRTIKFKDFFENSIECFVSMRNEKRQYFQKIFEKDSKLYNTDPSNASRYLNGEAQLPKKHCAYIILEQESIYDTFLDLIKDKTSFSDAVFRIFLQRIIEDYATSEQQRLLFGKVFSFEKGEAPFTIVTRMMDTRDEREWAKCMSKILLISAINELSTTSSETETNGISGTGGDDKNQDDPVEVSGQSQNADKTNEYDFLTNILSTNDNGEFVIYIMRRIGVDLYCFIASMYFHDLLKKGMNIYVYISTFEEQDEDGSSYKNAILIELLKLEDRYKNLSVMIGDVPIFHQSTLITKYEYEFDKKTERYVITKPYFWGENHDIISPAPASIFCDEASTTPFFNEFNEIWDKNKRDELFNLSLYLSCSNLDCVLQSLYEYLEDKDKELREKQRMNLRGKSIPLETVRSILDNSIPSYWHETWITFDYQISDEIKETIRCRQSIKTIRQILLDVYKIFYKVYDEESYRDAIDKIDRFSRLIASWHHPESQKLISWNTDKILDILNVTRNELADAYRKNFLGTSILPDPLTYLTDD